MKHLIFDTETTGLPTDWKAPTTDVDKWPRVVEIALEVLDDELSSVLEWHSLIRPDGWTIPADATALHGIATEDAIARGIPIAEALDRLLEQVAGADRVVAHGLRFDRKVIEAELARRGRPIEFLAGKQTACTMVAGTAICRIPQARGSGFKFPKLSELVRELFAEEPPEGHAAAEDVALTVRCYRELIRTGAIQ